MRRALVRIAALLAVAATLAGCAMATRLAYMNVGLVYGNADSLLSWLADDYFDLTRPQEDFVRDRLARAMAWHRAEELPAWQRFLEDCAVKAEEPFRPEDVSAAWIQVREFYRRSMGRLVPSLTELLLQLDPDQVAYMERRFARENQRVLDESTGREAAADRRADRLLLHLEEFTGALDREQRKLVHRRVAMFPDTAAERVADWRRRQAELLAIAKAKPPLDQAEPVMRRITIDTEKQRTPDYARKVAERDRLMQALIVELSATLSREQREYLKRRLRGFAQDLRPRASP